MGRVAIFCGFVNIVIYFLKYINYSKSPAYKQETYGIKQNYTALYYKILKVRLIYFYLEINKLGDEYLLPTPKIYKKKQRLILFCNVVYLYLKNSIWNIICSNLKYTNSDCTSRFSLLFCMAKWDWNCLFNPAMSLIFKLNLFKAKFNAESTSEGQCKLTPPEGEREIVWDRHFNSFAYIYIYQFKYLLTKWSKNVICP